MIIWECSDGVNVNAWVDRFEERFFQIREREITLMETQVNHRVNIEKTVITGDTRRSHVGMVLGFILAGAGMYFAYRLGMNGHDILAGTMTLADIGTLAGIFVYGSSTRRKERQDRLEVMTQEKAAR